MPHIQRFLSSVGVVVVGMLVPSVVESIFAFQRSRWRTAHLPINLGLAALTLTTNLLFTIGLVSVGSAIDARPATLGLVIGGIVVLDFCTYLAHRLMHHIPLLWPAHRLHHADPLVGVTTTLRQHPVEGLWRFAFIAVPALLMGLPLEAVVLYRLISTVNALLEHTNVRVWPPLDRMLSWLVVTPNMHKVHHSEDPREADTNFGNILSVCDRVLRTFTPSERSANVLDLSTEETASALAMTEQNVKVSLHRARKKLDEAHRIGRCDAPVDAALVESFARCLEQGDIDGLTRSLAADVRGLVDDGGGKRKPSFGLRAVSRQWANALGRYIQADRVRRVLLNGELALVVDVGGVALASIHLETRDSRVAALRVILDPPRLARTGFGTVTP